MLPWCRGRNPLRSLRARLLLAGFLLPLVAAATPAAPLWPGLVPGELKVLPPESDVTKPSDELIAGRPVIRLGNVSQPTLTIYRPDPAKDTGAAVLVCPGGGYYILAIDLEGTEVCAWLNTIGVTGVLLKYRVPRRDGLPHFLPALQDAQRAMGLLRAQAPALGIDPQRIGVLGFSAGAHLAATLSHHESTRTYPDIDAADQVSSHPDFCVLIYPAYLTDPNQRDKLAPELVLGGMNPPPTFIAQAQDDSSYVDSSLVYYRALKNANIPAELHLYPSGGHGYGLRRTEVTVTTWPDRVEDWMRSAGWLNCSK
jgi:acetyl esterase/lipase